MWINWSPHTLLVGVNGVAVGENNFWQFLKELYIELPCDPAVSHLDIYPKELKTVTQINIYTCILIALFTTN